MQVGTETEVGQIGNRNEVGERGNRRGRGREIEEEEGERQRARDWQRVRDSAWCDSGARGLCGFEFPSLQSLTAPSSLLLPIVLLLSYFLSSFVTMSSCTCASSFHPSPSPSLSPSPSSSASLQHNIGYVNGACLSSSYSTSSSSNSSSNEATKKRQRTESPEPAVSTSTSALVKPRVDVRFPTIEEVRAKLMADGGRPWREFLYEQMAHQDQRYKAIIEDMKGRLEKYESHSHSHSHSHCHSSASVDASSSSAPTATSTCSICTCSSSSTRTAAPSDADAYDRYRFRPTLVLAQVLDLVAEEAEEEDEDAADRLVNILDGMQETVDEDNNTNLRRWVLKAERIRIILADAADNRTEEWLEKVEHEKKQEKREERKRNQLQSSGN